jgi:hypothetical protein
MVVQGDLGRMTQAPQWIQNGITRVPSEDIHHQRTDQDMVSGQEIHSICHVNLHEPLFRLANGIHGKDTSSKAC